MSATVKEWLRNKFQTVVSVQGASLTVPHVDIAVQCWTGVRIHVYLLSQPVSTRALKRALQDNTQIGINTMFLVDRRVLPDDGSRVSSVGWLLAIQELNNERVYVYTVTDGEPDIIQLHLEKVVGSSDYKVWYGPSVPFNQLRYFRKGTKLRSVKGNWLIADFGSRAFWRNTDYRNKRAQVDQRQRRGNTRWESWSGFQTWGGVDDSERGREQYENRTRQPVTSIGDYLKQCYATLSLAEGASEDEVKAAYRQHAIRLHPDTSDLPSKEAHDRFQKLTRAYHYIKSANGWS